MQMTCTILHSGKQKPIYNSQKKGRKKILLPLLLYCPLLGFERAPSEKPRSLQPPPVRFTYRSIVFLLMQRWNGGMTRLHEARSYFWCFNSLLLHPAAPLCPCWSHLYTDDTVGPLRRQKSVSWWQRGEQHAWGVVEAERWVGGWGREGMYCERNPFYTVCLPGWMAIHLELQVISSPTARPVLSAVSKMTKKKNKKTTQNRQPTTEQETP